MCDVCCVSLQLCSVSGCPVLQRRQGETCWASEGNRHAGVYCPAHHLRGLSVIREEQRVMALCVFEMTGLLLLLRSCASKTLHFLDGEFVSAAGVTMILLRWLKKMLHVNHSPPPLLLRWNWKVLVVDEAHRLKNQNSLLHKTLTKVRRFPFFLSVFRLCLTVCVCLPCSSQLTSEFCWRGRQSRTTCRSFTPCWASYSPVSSRPTGRTTLSTRTPTCEVSPLWVRRSQPQPNGSETGTKQINR